MGVLSDVIVARTDEAGAILSARGGHEGKWPTVDLKGLDNIKLGTLAFILAGKSVDDIDGVVGFIKDSVVDGGKNGPWIYEIPRSLQDALVAFPWDRQDEIISQWAETEEFQLDGFTPADVEEYLQGLLDQAQLAKETGKSMLLLVSL